MRTFQYRESLAASSAITELKAIDLQLQTHSKITVALYTTSTNVRIKLKYVFGTDQPKSMAVSGGGIRQSLMPRQQTLLYLSHHLMGMLLGIS